LREKTLHRDEWIGSEAAAVNGAVMTPQILEERLIDFAVTIVSAVGALPSTTAGTLGITHQKSAIICRQSSIKLWSAWFSDNSVSSRAWCS